MFCEPSNSRGEKKKASERDGPVTAVLLCWACRCATRNANRGARNISRGRMTSIAHMACMRVYVWQVQHLAYLQMSCFIFLCQASKRM